MSKNVKRIPWIFDAAGQMEGRDRSGAYPGLVAAPFNTYGTFTSATTDISTMVNHGFGASGSVAGPVRVASSGTLPTGLAASTDYWVFTLAANFRDTFSFASSEANAVAGTAIDITGAGSGTHTLSMQNIFNLPLAIDQIKVDTGDGGDVLLTYTSDAQDRLLKLDNTPANDTLWVSIRKTVEALYVQTLPANGSLEVYTGFSAEE
jgi:hypothetical protein